MDFRSSTDSEMVTQHHNALGVAPVRAHANTDGQALVLHKVGQAHGYGPDAGDGGGNSPAWNTGHGQGTQGYGQVGGGALLAQCSVFARRSWIRQGALPWLFQLLCGLHVR